MQFPECLSRQTGPETPDYARATEIISLKVYRLETEGRVMPTELAAMSVSLSSVNTVYSWPTEGDPRLRADMVPRPGKACSAESGET